MFFKHYGNVLFLKQIVMNNEKWIAYVIQEIVGKKKESSTNYAKDQSSSRDDDAVYIMRLEFSAMSPSKESDDWSKQLLLSDQLKTEIDEKCLEWFNWKDNSWLHVYLSDQIKIVSFWLITFHSSIIFSRHCIFELLFILFFTDGIRRGWTLSSQSDDWSKQLLLSEQLKTEIDEKGLKLVKRKGVIFYQDNTQQWVLLVSRQKLIHLGWEFFHSSALFTIILHL